MTPNIKIVYVFPSPAIVEPAERYAIRFIESYNQFPPSIPHETVVVLNGWKYNLELECLFSSLPKVMFLEHDNSGMDIGAYQLAAQQCSADLMMFLGMSSYLRIPNWLLLMVSAWQKHGPGLYGVMANRGKGNVHPHIRTTGFLTNPQYMNQYPTRITRPEQRYPFEWGPDCLSNWFKKHGMKLWVVASTGVYPWERWDTIPGGGFHQGAQGALLCGDRMSSPPYWAVP